MADNSRKSSRGIITIAAGLIVGAVAIAGLYAAIGGMSFGGALALVWPIALVVLIGTVLLRWFGTRRH